MDEFDINEEVNGYIDAATLSILEHGRYWNGGITSTAAARLKKALLEEGFKVEIYEVAPDWEHVFFILNDQNSYESIEIIAEKRAKLNLEGKAYLPI